MLTTHDFYYDLPERLIAQTPLSNRSASRLLVLNRETGQKTDTHFHEVLDYLEPGDALIVNETRVIPARLFGVKPETGGHLEVLLLTNTDGNCWECLVKPARRARIGTEIHFGEDARLKATVIEEKDQGGRIIEFSYEGVFLEVLESLGQMPLPPYIKERLDDSERYQTVYAKHNGSAAAPTAGLHFTPELLQEAKSRGIDIIPLTLHVGLGTFRPVSVDRIEDHEMHAEYYSLSQDSANRINQVRQNGKRIVAVGTTSIRTLETIAQQHGGICASSGWTSIFISPGFDFKVVNALITNFHLPCSTLVMLVSAFYNRESVLKAYQHAVQEEYRFFSFGDAMLII